jgi:hypothetical protein
MPLDFVPAALKIMTAGIAAPGSHSMLAKEMLLNIGRTGH